MAKANVSKRKELKEGSITFRLKQSDKDKLFDYCYNKSISVSVFLENLILDIINKGDR